MPGINEKRQAFRASEAKSCFSFGPITQTKGICLYTKTVKNWNQKPNAKTLRKARKGAKGDSLAF